MDLNDLNTRVVFKEPRGMIRWLQLLFAIIAISTVMDFSTTVGVDITCPPVSVTQTPQSTVPIVSPQPSQPQPQSQPTQSNVTNTPSSTPAAVVQQDQVTTPAPLAQLTVNQVKLVINYPFDFTNQPPIYNPCKGHNYSYSHLTSLSGSPFFFSMTGFLALLYAALSLVVYLFFSTSYNSAPIIPVIDLISSGIISLFWIIASFSFSIGVSLLKTTANYENIEQGLCQPPFLQAGGKCTNPEDTEWKSLNIGLLAGYTSFFLWGFGMWFVYKETHFHTPREQFG